TSLLVISVTALAEPPAPPSPAPKPSESTDKGPAPLARPDAPQAVSPARSETALSRGMDVEPMVVREPSQGRPIFIEPDGEFYFVMRVSDRLRGSDVSFSIVNADEPSIQVPLLATTPPSFVNNEFANLLLKVPNGTIPGLYDLAVRSKQGEERSRHCVKVVDKFKTKFRFVHLSNMNVGDPTAPEFDWMLPEEVNLLAPEFIVATGDYTEWSRARNEPESWLRVLDYFAKFDSPVFLVCGQHDHEDSFLQLVANSPVGTIDYGAYHGLLLLDHPGHPIDQDFDQLRVLEADLQRNR